MADLSYGSGSGDWREAIRRAQDQARATDELNQKEDQRRSVEERATQAEGQSARTRTGLAGATDELTTRLELNTAAIKAETAALEVSIGAMERALALRRQIAQTPIISSGSRHAAGGVATAGGFVGVEEDPQAGARLTSAQRALADAEIARANAQAQVRQTRARQGTTPEVLAPLVEQRELAAQQVQAARAELRSAQANVVAQESLAQQKAQQLQEQRQINAALQAERIAAERSAAEASTVAVENAAGGRGPLLLGPAQGIQAGPIGSTPDVVYAKRPPIGTTRATGGFLGTTVGGPADRVALPEDAGAAERLQALRKEATSNAAAIAAMGGEQAKANQAFREASVIYADNSTRLTRHGALTTEFIQALARGQVTLGEFGSQMTATIGKFGGWVVAGAAIYGVYDAFKHLLSGATETQAAVQQLGRFIPGLGGPAGGGRTQIGAAAASVRDISTQFNVPIKDVTDAMQVMARVFPNLVDAGNATRAVLAASRLDQVPAGVSTQYLTGIAQSLGFAGQPGGGARLVGIVNSLNSLQSLLGARVNQTLPALARAAPAAYAGGLGLGQLEALTALGVRAGIPGNQVGTALLRSIGTFSNRSTSQLSFREYGIEPVPGEYGGLISQVIGTINRRARGRGTSGPGGTGPLSGIDLRNLAVALGGPLLGSRTILPILAAEQLRPGTYDRALGLQQRPRPYQEDLGAVLGTVGERFKAIGIGLQNFGSRLEQAGLLTPITGLLNAFVFLTHVIEQLTSPIAQVLGVFNQLPGVVRDAIGVFVAFRAGSYLLNTRFGGGAQQLLGQLPGLSTLRNDPRFAVEGIRSNLEREILPVDQRAAEDATLRFRQATQRVVQAQNNLDDFQAKFGNAANLPLSDPRAQSYQAGITERRASITSAEAAAPQAEQRAQDALEQVARTQAQIELAKNSQYTWAERSAILEEEGFVASSETVDLTKELAAAYETRIAAMRAGTVEGALPVRPVSGSAVGEGAVVAGAAAAAVTLSTDSAVLANVQSGLQSTGIGPAPGVLAGASDAAAAEKTAAERYLAGERAGAALRGTLLTERFGEGARPIAPVSVTAGNPTLLERAGGKLGDAADSVVSAGGRLRSAVEDAGGLRQALGGAARGAVASPFAPFGYLLGSQLLGGAIGGGVGSYISNVGGQAATGAIIAQLLGHGGVAGSLLGGTLGAVAGNFSQGNGLLSLAGGAGGAGIGALIGSFLGGPGLGSLVGAFAGSTIIPAIFGSQPSPQDIQQQANLKAANIPANERQALAGGNAAIHLARAAGQDQFGQQFGQNLLTSYLASGTSQQSAQANVKATIDRLQGELLLYGPQSKQGKAAQSGLNDVIGAAIDQAAVDPSTAYQLVQQVTSTRQRPIQDKFTYLLQQQAGTVQDIAGPSSAASQAAKEYQEQIVGPFYQKYIDAQAALHDADSTLQQAIASGSQKRIAAGRIALQRAQTDAQGATGVYTLAQQAGTVAEQAFYRQQYQAQAQLLAAQGQGAQAAAGGSQKGQLQAQLGTATQQLSNVLNVKGKIDPTTFATARDSAQAQIVAIQNQIAAQPLTEIAARGAVSVARAPVGDPVAAARLQLQSYRDQLKYMQANAHAFDPSSINDMIAQVVAAERTLAQTGSDFAIQMNDINTQIAAAQEYGNAVQQAATNVAGARRDTALAVTPQQRGAARLNVLTQQNAAHQAVLQRIQAEGQLAQAQQAGDPVAAARAAQRTAQRELANAHGIDEQISAETALATANYQYQQALADHYTALGQLAASTSVNPVVQLRDQAKGLARALSVTAAPAARIQIETQLNSTKHQYEQTLIDQRSSIIDFQFQMMQITGGQAVKQLQDLTHLKGITLAQRQQILEQVRRYQLGQETPLGATGFDLAPGNIKLPTYYDVAHGTGAARPNFAAMNHIVNASAATQINVYVQRSEDVPRVGDVIERATGARLRGKLRAAGVT